jgi:hypothetical protein
MSRIHVCTALLCLAALQGAARAQQGKVIAQQRSPSGEGYTVMAVWGAHHELGYAQGFLLAKEITR